MKARFKIGLAVGLVGLIVNICASFVSGLCGPAVALIGGIVAGFLTGRQEKAVTKSAGAQGGAISGAVAGALMIVGQIIGGIAALVYLQTTGTSLPFGTIPPSSAGINEQLPYYLSGVGAACCFGLVGLALAALTGAGGGYLGTPNPEPEIPSI